MLISGRRPLDRRILAAVRLAVAVALLAAVVLAVAPAFMSGPRRGQLEGWGAVALVALLWIGASWMLPLAIFGGSTVRLDGEVLTAETLRGRRAVALSRVDRIWARRVPSNAGMLVLAGLGGEEQPEVWFLWGGSASTSYGSALAELLRGLARSPGVQVSQRAAIILGLGRAPSGLTRWGLWLRGLGLYTAVAAAVAGVLVAYAVALG